MLICGSPRLIAAYRVLLRQSVPWHPPCALVRLIFAVLLHPPKTVEAEQDTVVVLLLSFPCAVFKMRLKILTNLQNDTVRNLKASSASSSNASLSCHSLASACFRFASASFHPFGCLPVFPAPSQSSLRIPVFDLGSEELLQLLSSP